MNLRDILRNIYARSNKNITIPNPETQQRLTAFVNFRHRDVLVDFPQLRDTTLSFDSVASTQAYALPEQGIARINRIFETTNDQLLRQQSLAWLRTVDPDPQTGTPYVWVPDSWVQVHTQPSNASEIFVDSTSASDTTRCYVEGLITGGHRMKAEVSMTGTTAVTLSSSITNWIQIDKFYLKDAAVGTVTLHEDASGGTELSRIAIGDTYAKYLSFLLYPTPSGVTAYTCDVTRGIADMVNPLDEPLLPEDFHSMLMWGALIDEYAHTDDSRKRDAEVEWDRWHKKLTSWIVAHPSARIDLNAESLGSGRSSFGGMFPAGS